MKLLKVIQRDKEITEKTNIQDQKVMLKIYL